MATTSEQPRFPQAEYDRRYVEVRRRMRERGLDVLLVYGDSGSHGGNHANIKYLSNYQDPVASYLVFPREGEPALYISNRLYLPYARRVSVIPETDAVDYDPAGKVERRIRELGLEKGAIALVGFRGILQASLPHGPVSHWKETLGGASFTDATDLLAAVRLVKSKAELAWFRRGAELTDLTFEALEKKARAGMTDFQLTGLIAGACIPRGGWPKVTFVGSTSMARPHIVFPNQFPNHRRIRKGDVVLTELSADYEMHSGQAHRPIAVGTKPTPIYQKLYEVAVEAYERILRALVPGANQDDVRRAASVIPQAGFTTFDATLHGWGLLIEDPRVDVLEATLIKRPQGQIVFQEGMLMVIQPNVVTADGQRGLQVGNLVEITKTGARSMQKYPMKFMRI